MRIRIRLSLSIFTSALLVLQSLYFLWLSYGVFRLFRGAQNVSASDPLPGAVWTNLSWAIVLIILAIVYLFDPWQLSRRLFPLAIGAIGYGIWAASSTYRLMISIGAAFHGDVVALTVLSGTGFIAIGVAGLAVGLMRK